MSIFKNILNKLGIKKSETEPEPTELVEAAPVETAPAEPTPQVVKPAPAAPKKPSGVDSLAASYMAKASQPAAPVARPVAPARPVAISVVDVVSNLEKLAAASKEKLDWKVSIVDLMKLLGLDSSFKARKELAIELGCPSELMEDSAKMNVWLHKTVLQKVADNGGNIPKELLS